MMPGHIIQHKNLTLPYLSASKKFFFLSLKHTKKFSWENMMSTHALYCFCNLKLHLSRIYYWCEGLWEWLGIGNININKLYLRGLNIKHALVWMKNLFLKYCPFKGVLMCYVILLSKTKKVDEIYLWQKMFTISIPSNDKSSWH